MAFNALMKPAVNQTRAQVEAIGAAGNGVAGFFYMTSDTNAAGQQVYGVGQSDGSIAFLGYEGDAPLQSVGTTPTVAMAVDANGEVTANTQFSAAADNIASAEADGIYVKDLAIAPDSQSRLSYDAATRTIGITALGMTNVTTNTTAADVAAFVAAEYTAGNEYQEGDVVILTSNNTAYIHNGGTAGDANDFTVLETPDLDAAAIRALFSSGNAGIDYNASTGTFTLTLDPDAANDLSITGAGLMLDVSAAPVIDTNDLLGGGPVAVSLQALLDEISGTDHFNSFSVEGTLGAGFTVDEQNDAFNLYGTGILSTNTGDGSSNNMTIGFSTVGATAGQVAEVYDNGGTLDVRWGNLPASYSFDLEGNSGDTYTVEEDQTVAITGGNLLTTVVTDGTGLAINLDTTGATSGQAIVFDGTNPAWSDIQSPLSFENGLTESGGTVKLGGELTQDTVITGQGHTTNWEATDTTFTADSVPVDDLRQAYASSNGTDANYVVIEDFSGSGTPPTAGIGDTITVPSTNSSTNLPQGTYTILDVDIQNFGDNFTYQATIDYSDTLVNDFQASSDFIFTSTQAVGGNVFVGQDLHIKTDNLNTIPNYRPAIMQDTATGKIGFAPYSLPNSVGGAGQVLKVQNDGSLDWETDSSNLNFNNGLNENNGLVRLGGDLIEDTTISTNGNDLILEGGTQTTSTLNDTTFITRHVNSSSSEGVKQIFASGRYAIQSINPANDAVNFGIQFSGNGATFIDTRSTKEGFTYTAPNPSHWTPDTLITKAYADTLVQQAENGIFYDNAAGKLKLGGNLTQNTSINLSGNEFTWAGQAGDSVRSTIDMEFLNATAGVVFVAPQDNTKWRIGVDSLGNGAATLRLEAVV